MTKSSEERIKDEIIRELTENKSVTVEDLLNIGDQLQIAKSAVANTIDFLHKGNVIFCVDGVCEIANRDMLRHMILSVIDENKGMARKSTISNILSGNNPLISNVAVGAALYDLLKEGIIVESGPMYCRK